MGHVGRGGGRERPRGGVVSLALRFGEVSGARGVSLLVSVLRVALVVAAEGGETDSCCNCCRESGQVPEGVVTKLVDSGLNHCAGILGDALDNVARGGDAFSVPVVGVRDALVGVDTFAGHGDGVLMRLIHALEGASSGEGFTDGEVVNIAQGDPLTVLLDGDVSDLAGGTVSGLIDCLKVGEGNVAGVGESERDFSRVSVNSERIVGVVAVASLFTF